MARLSKCIVSAGLISLFCGTALFAQKKFDQELVMSEGEDELMADANFFYEKGDYLTAAPMFEKLFHHFEGRFEYKHHLGVCYTYTPEKADLALTLLEETYADDPSSDDILYYLGKAYHLNHRFDQALGIFKKAKTEKTLTNKQEEHVNRLIINCNNGKQLIKTPLDIRITDLGPPVNSEGSEYVPVISSDETVLIFTYKGKRSLGGLQKDREEENKKGYYFEDVNVSYKLGDTWLNPERLGPQINSYTHDAGIALSGNGQTLFIYKYSKEGGGDIYQSDLSGTDWGSPEKLNGNINTAAWEGSASLSPDGKTLYFTSERPGGKGGKDIYRSTMDKSGNWGAAVNLGSEINTPDDEDAPFIHPDGKTLYFSSTGHFNMGNYDIFKSVWSGTSWSKPENMGYPLNTAGDDIFYVVSANGKRGYFSSGRPGGMGGQDIYVADLSKVNNDHALVLLKGVVTANDSAVGSVITVKFAENNSVQGVYKGNTASGSYLINLPIGHDYEVLYDVAGFDTHRGKISAVDAKAFIEIVRDVDLYAGNTEPAVTIDGNVLYSESPLKPAAGVTVSIEDKEGKKPKTETTADSRGYFKFQELNAGSHYVLSLDANDRKLKAYVYPLITGHARLGGEPEEGLRVNETATDETGFFRIQLSDDQLLSSNLPATEEALKKVDFSDPEVYREVLDKYGDTRTDELIFKVQVGAYKSTRPVDFSHLSGLGEIDKQTLEDGLIRYTIGELKTLRESEQLKNRAIQQGQGDAFILIFYKGQRRILSEAVASGFFKPDK